MYSYSYSHQDDMKRLTGHIVPEKKPFNWSFSEAFKGSSFLFYMQLNSEAVF